MEVGELGKGSWKEAKVGRPSFPSTKFLLRRLEVFSGQVKFNKIVVIAFSLVAMSHNHD